MKKYNVFVCDNKICKILIYDKLGKLKGTAIIDKEDRNKAEKYVWAVDDGYAKAIVTVSLHHLILQKKDGLLNDHIDRNRLNNTKSNLRYATHIENMRNKNVKGYDFKFGKYYPRIKVDGKSYFFGKYDRKEDAINIRKIAEFIYFNNLVLLPELTKSGEPT